MGGALPRSLRACAVVALLLGCATLRLRYEVARLRLRQAELSPTGGTDPEPAAAALQPQASTEQQGAHTPDAPPPAPANQRVGYLAPDPAASTSLAPPPKTQKPKGCAPADTDCIAALLRWQLSFTGVGDGVRSQATHDYHDYQVFSDRLLMIGRGVPPPTATASTSTSTGSPAVLPGSGRPRRAYTSPTLLSDEAAGAAVMPMMIAAARRHWSCHGQPQTRWGETALMYGTRTPPVVGQEGRPFVWWGAQPVMVPVSS